MSLGYDITQALPELRAQALSTMPDTGRFSRAGAEVFNPATGALEPGAETVVYSGPCRLRAPSAVEIRRIFGEEQVTVTRYIAAVPYDVTGIRIGDTLTMTSTADTEAAAVTWRVVMVPVGTDLVLRAIGVEAVDE